MKTRPGRTVSPSIYSSGFCRRDVHARVRATWPLADVGAWGNTQKVEADVYEHLAHDHPGLRGDLTSADGLPVEAAAVLVVQAFAAYAKGDWDAFDRLIARGRGAWGEAFAGFVAYVVSPAFSYRPANPAWDAYLARLAVTVLSPGLQEPSHRPGRHRRPGAHCAYPGAHRPR